jgi:mannose-1-phosphate guanylyltransferase
MGRRAHFVEQQSTGEVAAHENGDDDSDEESLVCGLVLAGGEGKRLQPFIKSLGKGELPKQYVNFIGTRSMLEHTLERAKRVIPSERVFTIITESHLKHPEVREQISSRPKDTVIVQPENKETAAGLLLPLMYLHKRYPSSLVLVLPSDHFVREEDRLMDYTRLACRAVWRDPSRMILLGVKPDRDEPEYGYLLPIKKPSETEPKMSEISWFIEKPEQKIARRLMRAGGLWNTMIMAFKTSTMLYWISRLAPALYHQFRQIYQAIGTPGETEVVREVYRRLEPINFSKEFLEPMVKSYPSSLIALPVRDLLWSDWGTASRIRDVLKKIGQVPEPNGYRTEKKIAKGYKMNSNFQLNDSRFDRSQVAIQK